MKDYEALFIIDPDKESAVKTVTEGIAEAIKKNGGKIEKEENWGKQRLSYPIQKRQEAIYYKLIFSVDPSKISILNNSYKLNGDIMRTMITTK